VLGEIELPTSPNLEKLGHFIHDNRDDMESFRQFVRESLKEVKQVAKASDLPRIVAELKNSVRKEYAKLIVEETKMRDALKDLGVSAGTFTLTALASHWVRQLDVLWR